MFVGRYTYRVVSGRFVLHLADAATMAGPRPPERHADRPCASRADKPTD
jgi:hypothetical protein